MVPEDTYSPSYLREEPLDKSYDFISHCAIHGYHIRWAGLGARPRAGLGARTGSRPHHCPSLQPHQLVPVLPQRRHLALSLLQQRGSALWLPRSGCHEPHV